MSDKKLSLRHEKILFYAQMEESYALSDIAEMLQSAGFASVSAPTLRRDMVSLCKLGFFQKSGSRKSTRYSIRPDRFILAPIDPHKYCNIDIDRRPGSAQYNFNLFTSIPASLFDCAELSKLQDATKRYLHSSKGASPAARRKELERFVVELSWKSSKIEGNTYTLLDTELLLLKGVEAAGHAREEAVMILNHKRAFDHIMLYCGDFANLRLSHISEIHRLLVSDLNIDYALRKRLIGITGSLYRPLSIPTQIEEACAAFIAVLQKLQDPYSRALLTIAGISYIQPFEDGNKRTARLAANAVLLASDCAPLSYRSVSEVSYREAILTFYERNTVLPLKELFIEQYVFACENYMQFAERNVQVKH